MKTLEEAHAIPDRDRDLLTEIKALVRRRLPGATILLYGSAARGKRHAESDYDLLVLTEAPLSMNAQNAMRDAIFDLTVERDAVVCTMFYSKAEWDNPPVCASPFHENVQREAVWV